MGIFIVKESSVHRVQEQTTPPPTPLPEGPSYALMQPHKLYRGPFTNRYQLPDRPPSQPQNEGTLLRVVVCFTKGLQWSHTALKRAP